MSRLPDGTHECDRCGHNVGNGAVDQAAKVVDTDPDTGNTTQRDLHLCRDRPDPDRPGKTIQGCRDRVLTRKALRHYHEKRAATA